MKKFLKIFLPALVIILGLLAVVLFLWNQLNSPNSPIESTKRITRSEIEQNLKKEVSYELDDDDNGVTYPIGNIIIPTLNLDLVINKGISESALTDGVGTYKEAQLMGKGNYVLMAHNYPNSFGKLESIETGAKVYITDLERIYLYEVYESKVIEATNVEVVKDVEGEKRLTLITCHGDLNTPYRRVVIAKAIKSYRYSEMPKDLMNYLRNNK